MPKRGKASPKLPDLYATYRNYVLSVLQRILGTRVTTQDVEDLAQDVFLKLAPNIERLDGSQNIKAYVSFAARSVAFDHLRRRKRTAPPVSLDDDTAAIDVVDVSEDMEHRTDRKMLRETLKRHVAKLPPVRGRYLHLFLMGFTPVEIAKITDSSQATVRIGIHYGAQQLRTLLAET